ncbi:MAG: SRPBCC family protein, partial [Acidimicrobiia bacterium]|nr:SRPBCC family protein [Acidimicrobiia bacterium]
MVQQSFTHQALTPVAPTDVWRSLQRPETWGAIGGVKRIGSATYDNEGDLTGYQFTVEIAGTEHAGTATRISHAPDRTMVMAIDSGQLSGAIGFELTPTESGTRVTVDMRMSPNGFLASIMFPIIAKAV